MKNILSKLAPLVLGFAAHALPASAQIIVPGDRIQLNAFNAGLPGDTGGQIEFLIDPDNNGIFDSVDQSAGFRYQSITGFGTVYDFCTDFYTGEDGDMTYLVSSGLGSIDPLRQAQIRALFSNAVPGFDLKLQDTSTSTAATGPTMPSTTTSSATSSATQAACSPRCGKSSTNKLPHWASKSRIPDSLKPPPMACSQHPEQPAPSATPTSSSTTSRARPRLGPTRAA